MTTQRDALARSICARLCVERRTIDELRVVDDVLAGLEQGAETIGPLDLEQDDRDWSEEAAQECRDLLAYLAMRKVAAQHRRRERLACAASDAIEPGLRELAAFGPTGNEAADIHQWRDITPLPPAPDPMALRLQDLAHKIDEHGARVVELRNEVAAQSAARRRQFDVSDEEETQP